jgi:hypothetical protein
MPKPMKHNLATLLCLCLLWFTGPAQAQAVVITAEQWAATDRTKLLREHDGLQGLLSIFEYQPQGVLIVHHPRTQQGAAWAEAFRTYLVALGIASKRIQLIDNSDASELNQLKLEVRNAPIPQ